MTIENRDPSTGLRTGLKAGTRLVARYKGQEYSAEVVQTEKGLRYRLADGREFKSPSAAGSAVMGGTACNGWRFWSLADSLPVREAAQATKPGRRSPVRAKKTARQKPVEARPKATNRTAAFQRLPASADTAKGQARFFGNACMDAFTAPATAEPIGCPKGHSAGEQTAARAARSAREV